MPRKNAKNLSENREAINRRYRRGSKIQGALRDEKNLGDLELAVAQETACILMASGFSESYIADALSLTKGVINGWFKNDPSMGKRVAQVREEVLSGAVTLLRSYMVEAVQMLMEIARKNGDDKLAAQVLQDLLDRGGVSKVNKSESISAQTVRQESEVNLVDKSGLVSALKDASPEAQDAIATRMEEILAIAAEHTEMDVTHE